MISWARKVSPALNLEVETQLASPFSIQVVERLGTRKRVWIPFASAMPFPSVRTILPLVSVPAPPAAVVQASRPGRRRSVDAVRAGVGRVGDLLHLVVTGLRVRRVHLAVPHEIWSTRVQAIKIPRLIARVGTWKPGVLQQVDLMQLGLPVQPGMPAQARF